VPPRTASRRAGRTILLSLLLCLLHGVRAASAAVVVTSRTGDGSELWVTSKSARRRTCSCGITGARGVRVAGEAMVDCPLAAGRLGSVRRQARQLLRGRPYGCQPEAARLDMAAEGRPHLR
uniref:Uncharacterized protein n=1 Tax=Oryza brachyantha TaxID=4533 RepID=J3LPG9_ORYBR